MADRQQIAQTFLAKLKASPFMMVALTDSGEHSEPMTAQVDDDQPNTLFFFTHNDNRVAKGGTAMIQFVAKGHDLFACLHGQLSAQRDTAEIDKLWNKQAETWFEGGKSDPNLTLLRFDIDNAELWEADVSLAGRVKMLFGGTIKPGEGSSHVVVDAVG